MNWRSGLARQITIAMSILAVSVVALVVTAFYTAYAVLLAFFPTAVDENTVFPSGPDLLVIAFALLIALIFAVRGSLSLTSRILSPLNAIAEGARRIAQGDLSARVSAGDSSLGEIATLVEDFNTMGRRLNDMANDITVWNASIAHELRTPLTILKGRLQGIADGVFQPDNALIGNLIAQVDGLARLAEDLRIVTLADSGRLRLEIKTIDLATEAAGVVDLMQPMIAEAGFSVLTDLDQISILSDQSRLRQALIALIHNALRHANPGLLTVISRVEGSDAVLEVEDCGPGLSDTAASLLFTPWHRSEGDRLRATGGSGLGLSVVKVIAEAMGGHAAFRRAPNGGSIFSIRLPI